MILEGRRILVTGVLSDASIAFGVAKVAQEQGAEVVLSSFGRVMSITERVARKLPSPPQIVELDVPDLRDGYVSAHQVVVRWYRHYAQSRIVADLHRASTLSVRGGRHGNDRVVDAHPLGLARQFVERAQDTHALKLTSALGRVIVEHPGGAPLLVAHQFFQK